MKTASGHCGNAPYGVACTPQLLRYNGDFSRDGGMVSKSKNPSVKRSPKKTSTDKAAASVPQAKANGNGSTPSNGETLRNLYASLLRCRLMEEQVSRSPELAAKYDFVVGYEAVAVAGAAALTAGDTISASPRDLAALVAAGVSSDALRSDSNRCDRATLLGFTSLSDDPFNVGTGIALAYKLQKKQGVAVALGNQEASLDGAREALKLAGSGKLPVVYVIKNSSDGAAYAPHLKAVSLLARDGGFPGVIVDGQDVVAVWRVAQESVYRARNGGGPTLIDCRMDATRDPLAHMEHYLRKRSLWDEAWREKVEETIRAEFGVTVG
ncbi:MAG: thiamine pyrophosphate-dependent enzyme [Candidatus Korobacteraceae bacterium]